jgi:hypothetical protein
MMIYSGQIFLFDKNIDTFAANKITNSSGQGEIPDRRYSPRLEWLKGTFD